MKDIIQKNLAHIHQRIENACASCGRNSSDITLLMATKTVAAEHILHALHLGEVLIGENKVQELTEKCDALSIHPHKTHFIGHLQSNKIKTLIHYVDCIESVDRLSVANALEKQLSNTNKIMDILIQINSSAESSKFGCAPDETLTLVEHIATLPHIRIKGLMTIGLFSQEKDKVRQCFKVVQKIKKEIMARNIPHVSMACISMGMSNDLEIAIEEGATIIRVGTAIFGERLYPDSYYWNENKSS